MALQRENKALKDALDGTEQDAVRCVALCRISSCVLSPSPAHIMRACVLAPQPAAGRGALPTN